MTAAALVAATGSHFVMPEQPRAVAYEVTKVAAINESPSTVGIADSNIYFTDSLDEVKQRLDLIESLGVSDVRLLIPWMFIQTQDPMGGPVDWQQDLDWAKFDQIVAEVEGRGMGILGVLQWSPDWATSGETGVGHPDNVQDYADFAAAVAQRYGGKITSYEVWNEPNASFFFDPVDPVAYTNLLKAAYTALKLVDPNITVIGGVVGAGLTWGDVTMNPVDFVQAMYDAGADGFFDALSFHPYNFATPFSEQNDLDWSELMPLYQVSKIRELMDQHLAPGDEQLKIWITEYGLPTSVVSAETQRAFLADLMAAWQSFSGAGPIFLYSIKDDVNAMGDDRYFGIFDANGNFKGSAEAFAAFKKMIDCLDGCTPTDPTNPTNPLVSLVSLLQQIITQVLTFVPQLVAGVTQAVTNLLGSILGGLSGLAGAAAAPGGATGISLRSAAATGEEDASALDVIDEPGATDVDAMSTKAAEVGAAAGTEVSPAGEVVTEVPLTEVPVVEVPVVEEPVVEEPVVEVPVVEVPVVEEPVVEEPVVEEPVIEEPAVETPVTDPEVTEETSVTEEPVAPDKPDAVPATKDEKSDIGKDDDRDAMNASERASRKLGAESRQKSADPDDDSSERKRTPTEPKLGSGPPQQREARSVTAGAPASSGGTE